MSAPLLPNPVTVEITHPTVDAEVFVPQVTPEVVEPAVGVIVVPVEGGGLDLDTLDALLDPGDLVALAESQEIE